MIWRVSWSQTWSDFGLYLKSLLCEERMAQRHPLHPTTCWVEDVKLKLGNLENYLCQRFCSTRRAALDIWIWDAPLWQTRGNRIPRDESKIFFDTEWSLGSITHPIIAWSLHLMSPWIQVSKETMPAVLKSHLSMFHSNWGESGWWNVPKRLFAQGCLRIYQMWVVLCFPILIRK